MANPALESDWVDVPQTNQASESDWQDVPQGQTQKPQGMWDKIKSTASDADSTASSAIQPYINSQQGSPSSLLQSVPPLLNKVANKVGPAATEALSQGPNKVDPYTAAAVGTAASMSSDIAMMAANPMSEAATASKAVPEIATGFGRRALGFSKAMLKTPFARGQAQKAAGTALENDVIPLSGNPETALDNASNLANKSGQAIGSVLKNVPVNMDEITSNLDKARAQISDGFSGGLYQKAHSAIDDVQTNLKQLADKTKSSYGIQPMLGKPVMANEVNQIKTRLGRSINYLADLAAQSDNKTIVNNLANSVRDSVKSVLPPNEYADFIKNQKLFNTAELMKKGLNNEVAGQQGNRMFSPYSVIPAVGELAAGSPMKAAAALGVGETALRRSAGTTARALTEGYRAAPIVPEIGSKAVMDKTPQPAPHGKFVRQDGKIYKWDGQEYIEQ